MSRFAEFYEFSSVIYSNSHPRHNRPIGHCCSPSNTWNKTYTQQMVGCIAHTQTGRGGGGSGREIHRFITILTKSGYFRERLDDDRPLLHHLFFEDPQHLYLRLPRNRRLPTLKANHRPYKHKRNEITWNRATNSVILRCMWWFCDEETTAVVLAVSSFVVQQ